jgi:hypothetical protein
VVVIAATQADDMASAVRLKQEFGFDVSFSSPPFFLFFIVLVADATTASSCIVVVVVVVMGQLVILGGVEAELIAAQLASANVSVVLNPARSPPNTFSTWYRRPSFSRVFVCGVCACGECSHRRCVSSGTPCERPPRT